MQQTLSQRSDQEHLDLELLIVSEVLVQGQLWSEQEQLEPETH